MLEAGTTPFPFAANMAYHMGDIRFHVISSALGLEIGTGDLDNKERGRQ